MAKAAEDKKAKAAEAEATPSAAPEASTPSEKPKKAPKDSVSVDYRGAVRTFTKELNGDDFEDLAAQFAKKHNGKIL